MKSAPSFIVITAVAAFALTGCSAAADDGPTAAADDPSSAAATEIVIAEPVHGIGYLPLYVAIQEGYFADAGLDVVTTTLTGGAHVNSVLSGDAWGFIGGVESAAIANAKGADLVGVAGVVDRANIYWVARDGVEIDPDDIAGSLEGLTIAAGRHAGSVEIDTLYYLKQLGLDPETDVTILNNDNGTEIAVASSGQADIIATAEPTMGAGIAEGIWGEPFVSLPEELGPFAYSDIVTSRENVETDPATVQAFVDALSLGMDAVLDDPELAAEVAQKEFPNMTADTIQATLDRAYADLLWSGVEISEAALELDLEVARDAGLLEDSADPATFENIIVTEFFAK